MRATKKRCEWLMVSELYKKDNEEWGGSLIYNNFKTRCELLDLFSLILSD